MIARDDVDMLVMCPGSDHGQLPQTSGVLRGYGSVLGAVLAVIVMGATAMAFSSEVRRQVAISFVPQPEKYTELFFSGDGPREVSPGPGRFVVNVPFTVANHEGQAITYPYAVEVSSNTDALLARIEGSVDVPEAHMLPTTVAVDLPAAGAWSAIEVDLEGHSEHIRFLRGK